MFSHDDKPTNDVWIRLFSAVDKGDLKTIQQLIAENADLAIARDSSGDTLLHIATGSGRFEVAKFLIDQGADINATNKDDDTPLHKAVSYAKKEVVALLLDKKAAVDSFNKSKQSPLMCAIPTLSVDPPTETTNQIVHLLLSHGANANAADEMNHNALQRVILQENLHQSGLLLTLMSHGHALSDEEYEQINHKAAAFFRSLNLSIYDISSRTCQPFLGNLQQHINDAREKFANAQISEIKAFFQADRYSPFNIIGGYLRFNAEDATTDENPSPSKKQKAS